MHNRNKTQINGIMLTAWFHFFIFKQHDVPDGFTIIDNRIHFHHMHDSVRVPRFWFLYSNVRMVRFHDIIERQNGDNMTKVMECMQSLGSSDAALKACQATQSLDVTGTISGVVIGIGIIIIIISIACKCSCRIIHSDETS